MVRILTGDETQDKAHDSEDRLQIASQYAPHDRHDDDRDGSEDGDNDKLLGPYTLDELQPVGPCVPLIEGDEPIYPVVIGPYMGGMMVGVQELLGIRGSLLGRRGQARRLASSKLRCIRQYISKLYAYDSKQHCSAVEQMTYPNRHNTLHFLEPKQPFPRLLHILPERTADIGP